MAKVQAAFKGLESLKGLAAVGIALAAVGTALALSVGPAIAFEAAFANVEKTVDGTPAQLARVREEIIGMSNSMPLAATEIAGVAAAAGQLGIQIDDVSMFTETMVQLGTATDLSAETAATAMARFTNVMREPTERVPVLAAALTELGNNSAATESEILILANRMAGASVQFGLSSEHTLALAAAMKSLGIESESGGSAMSRVMQEIQVAVETGNDKLAIFADVLGVTTDQFRSMVETNPEQVLVRFIEGLQGIEAEGGSVLQVLGALDLDTIRLLRTILSLVGGQDQLADSFALVRNEAAFGSALLDEYGRFAETAAAKIEILKNRFTNLGIAIGTPLLGGIVQATEVIGDFVLGLQNLFGPLASEIFALISNIAQGFANLGSALAGIGDSSIYGFLEGLASILTALLSVVNTLPPSLLAVGAALLVLQRAGAVSLVLGLLGDAMFVLNARAAGSAVTLNGTAIGLRSVGAAGASAAAGLALALGPMALLTAAAIAFGREYNKLKTIGREAGEALAESMDAARIGGNIDVIAGSLTDARNRVRELRAEVDVFGASADDNFTALNYTIRSVFDVFTGGQATRGFRETKAELIGLEAELARQERTTALWRQGVAEAGRQLGLTRDEIIPLARELGVLEGLTSGNSTAWLASVQAIQEYVVATQDASEFTGRTAAELIDVGVSLQDYADRWETTADVIAFAAERAGVSQDTLADPTKIEENTRALGPFIAAWESAGEAIGASIEEIVAWERAVDGLIAANDRLISSMDRVQAARDAATFGQRNLTEATAEYEKQLDLIAEGEGDYLALATASRQLAEAELANGAAVKETTAAMDERIAAIIEMAAASGDLDSELLDLLLTYGRLSAEETGIISTEALANLARGKELTDELKQSLQDEFVMRLVAETGRAEEEVRRALAYGQEWVMEAWIAVFGADITPADLGLDQINQRAEDWDAGSFAAMAGLGIDDVNAGFSTINDAADNWDALDVEATARVDESQVISGFDNMIAKGNDYADGPYGSNPTVEQGPVISGFDNMISKGDSFANKPYPAKPTVIEGSVFSTFESMIRKGLDFARNYNATLTATDLASGVIRNAKASLAGFAGVHSARLVASFSTGSSGGSVQRSFGGTRNAVLAAAANGGIMRFANGGFDEYTAEKPGKARIFTPRNPGRIFAEPETGGESYIPLSPAKRGTALPVFYQTGKILGVFADGGFSRYEPRVSGNIGATQINVNAPVSIEVKGGDGASAADIGREVGRQVDRAMVKLTREIENVRG